jgi:hypothetical protein
VRWRADRFCIKYVLRPLPERLLTKKKPARKRAGLCIAEDDP